MSTMAWENSQPARPSDSMDPTERFYGSLVCVLALIFVTVIAAVLFMKGQSPGWGWVVIGSGLVGTYRVWVL